MNTRQARIEKKWLAISAERQAIKDEIMHRFLLEFNFNNNHIEGNTLTYGQTEMLLLFGKTVGDAHMRDLEEMKAHAVGLKIVIEEATQTDRQLTETFIRQIHKVLLREDYQVYRQLDGGKTTSYTVHAGQYKTRPNSVITATGERFEYASPEETPALMTDLLLWFAEADSSKTLTPTELAAVFHYRYIRIHPFEDGNGRIARLVVNFILARYGYPLIVVPSKHKDEYLSVLNQIDLAVGKSPTEGAQATASQVKPLTDYLEKLMTAQMKSDIDMVSKSNAGKWWYNGEMVTLNNVNTAEIVRLLSENPSITVRNLAEQVGINKSAVQRQLKQLQEKGYILRSGNATRTKWYVILNKM